jgi:ParB-like chromosome segregation protein Spo0J
MDGQIVDGRNRWAACKLANVECRTVEYTGDDPLGFVISLNLHRRQLSASQLAIVGVEVEALRSKEAVKRKSDRCREKAAERPRDPLRRRTAGASQVPQKIGEPARASEAARQAAKEIGVNHDYISKAKRLTQDAPELVKLVKSGELKLQDAATLAKMSKQQREQVFAQLENVRDVKAAITRVKTASPRPERRPISHKRWVASEELTRLRECFSNVLTGFTIHANGEYEPLIQCVRGLLEEAERAPRPGSLRSELR